MMAEQEKQLLLKDLCARLPYGVMCKIQTCFVFEDGTLRRGSYDKILDLETVTEINEWKETGELEKFKPYLRPMSSMTKNEKRELQNILSNNKHGVYLKHDEEWEIIVDSYYPYIPLEGFTNGFNWLNKKMFDYRGLIEKGLALEAPEGMYQIQ